MPIMLTYFHRCYVTPLLGAYIADTYWGRYKTICYAVAIALFGHILLIIAGVPGVIDSSGAKGAFIIALIVMGFGTGMFKANISPLVAEQYKRTKLFVITTRSGERVIVDPSLTTLRVYMVSDSHITRGEWTAEYQKFAQYFYELINIGALIGQIGMTYSEKASSSYDRDWHSNYLSSHLISSSASGSRTRFPPLCSLCAPSSYGSAATGTRTHHQPAPSWAPRFECSALLRRANGV